MTSQTTQPITVTDGEIQERFEEIFKIAQTRTINVIDFLGRRKVVLMSERVFKRLKALER